MTQLGGCNGCVVQRVSVPIRARLILVAGAGRILVGSFDAIGVACQPSQHGAEGSSINAGVYRRESERPIIVMRCS